MFRITLLSLLFVCGNSQFIPNDNGGVSDCEGKNHGPHVDNSDNNCYRYYYCLPGNNKQVLDCSQSNRENASVPVMYFDPSRKICTTQYQCPGLMDEATIRDKCNNLHPNQREAVTEDRTCKSFYVCNNDMNTGLTRVTNFVCDDNERFDPVRKQCTREYNDKCPTLPDENSEDCVGKPKGPHPDEKDCKVYYFCMAGNRKESFECTPVNSVPLYYDPEKKMCTSSYKCPLIGSDANGQKPEQYGNMMMNRGQPTNRVTQNFANSPQNFNNPPNMISNKAGFRPSPHQGGTHNFGSPQNRPHNIPQMPTQYFNNHNGQPNAGGRNFAFGSSPPPQGGKNRPQHFGKPQIYPQNGPNVNAPHNTKFNSYPTANPTSFRTYGQNPTPYNGMNGPAYYNNPMENQGPIRSHNH